MRRLVLASVLISLAGSACASPPMLTRPTDNAFTVGVGYAAYQHAVSVGSIALCLTGPGTATIRRVAIHAASGSVQVDAFAVRPNPFARGFNGLGTDHRSLAEIADGFDPGGVQQVSAVCPTDAQQSDEALLSKIPELGVQLSWTSGTLAGGNGIDITYEVDGGEHTAVIPFGIWLCAEACPQDLPAPS